MNALPPWLQVLYPFAPRWFAGRDGQLHYLDEGKGPPVVCLHGNPTWSFFYRELILALRGDFRCLVPDHLGCGLSDKPAAAPYRLADHIRRTEEWLGAVCDEPFHLVVHDWGGAIGMGLAVQDPERIRSLTILNTAAFPFPRIPLRIAACRVPLVGKVMVQGANAFVEAATRMTTAKPLPEAVKDGFRYPYRSWKDRLGVYRFVKDIPMRKGHPSWHTLQGIADRLSALQQHPATIVWGMQDWCFHADILKAWRPYLPSATVHTFDQAGHYLLEDAGEQVLPVIRAFLGEHA